MRRWRVSLGVGRAESVEWCIGLTPAMFWSLAIHLDRNYLNYRLRLTTEGIERGVDHTIKITTNITNIINQDNTTIMTNQNTIILNKTIHTYASKDTAAESRPPKWQNGLLTSPKNTNNLIMVTPITPGGK